MLRRISKVNDYRDEIKSCPSGVIDDIYEIKYFIGGYDTEIAATFENKGLVLEVIIPSSLLQQLPNGVLYRRASYKVVDTSYPDGYYNLEFIDNMNVWLGDDDVVPQPDPGYVTEEELTETLSDYATLSWISEQGYITSEALSGYATESWVSEQGFLTSETIPSDIATQSWVENQGYLTSVPSGYATEVWVSSQGYYIEDPNNSVVTEERMWDVIAGDGEDNPFVREDIMMDVLSDYATQSWVSSNFLSTTALTGYATESWVQSQGYYVPASSETVLCTIQPTDINPIVSTALIIGNYVSGDYVEGVELTNGGAALVKYDYTGQGTDYYDPFITESTLSYYVNLEGYATQSWVESQGYLTSTGISGLATQSWVESQGYLTSVPAGYATETFVTSALSDYATQSWVSSNFLSTNTIWTGTQSQWEQLTSAQQALYTIALITE